jgi:hypothetical protein
MGAGVADTASGTQSFTDTMEWSVSTASLNSGQLDLGLVYTTYAGKSPSVDSLTFQVFVDGSRIVNQDLAGPTAANTFFTNNLIDLGAVPMAGQVSGSVDVVLSLAETMSTPDGFGINYMLGDVPCFAAGTRIGTERGEVLVEDLQIGDRVRIVRGGYSEPVVWVGHRTVDCARHPKPQQVWPVRITAHALGPERPSRDLWLSPDHAVFVNDVLIPVKHLINGRTISQVPCDEVTYYHVELPQHSVLLAEGLPVESYLDTGDRAHFTNGGGQVVLHPDFASRERDARECAPLVVTGPELAAARRSIETIAGSTLPSTVAA